MTKKTEKRFDIVMVLIVLLAVAFLGYGAYYTLNKDSSQMGINTVTTEQKTISEKDNNNNVEIKVTYPQFKNLPNHATSINLDLEQMAKEYIMQFKTEVSESEPLPAEIEQLQSSLFVENSVAQANDSIVSVQYMISDFQKGAAHPNNYNETFNYNVETGKKISLSDLFIPGSNYVEVLSKIASKNLTEQDKKQGNDFSFFIQEGVGPKAENFQKFVLKPNELILIFDPYQAGPYAAGTRTVSIPLSELSDILREEYR